MRRQSGVASQLPPVNKAVVPDGRRSRCGLDPGGHLAQRFLPCFCVFVFIFFLLFFFCGICFCDLLFCT